MVYFPLCGRRGVLCCGLGWALICHYFFSFGVDDTGGRLFDAAGGAVRPEAMVGYRHALAG